MMRKNLIKIEFSLNFGGDILSCSSKIFRYFFYFVIFNRLFLTFLMDNYISYDFLVLIDLFLIGFAILFIFYLKIYSHLFSLLQIIFEFL